MTYTFEHAISDHADSSHERGHAVAAALQNVLPKSHVEFGYPGVVTARLASGAVARCGGPESGWSVDVSQPHGEDPEALDVRIPDAHADPAVIAAQLAAVLKHW